MQNPKPDPEIYLKAFEMAQAEPSECIIIEDSDVGYKAAKESGAFVCKVNGPEEVNYYRILKTILESEQINIVIPAAGQGKRFIEAGYQYPKPLIIIDGRPMLDFVLSNFDRKGNNILLVQEQHIKQYCIEDILKNEGFTVKILPVTNLTEGAACTVLLAKSLIDNEHELIIANSDQYLDTVMGIDIFIDEMRHLNADGGIMTFKSTHPKWSYAKCEVGTLVIEVAEKQAISDHATVGIYYLKHGKDFVKYAEQMIAKNIRTNNEFYVCPVFNEFIQANKKVYIHEIDEEIMHGLGTPEDLELFLKWGKNEGILQA